MELNRKGFTLVELLVTIVVVGLIMGVSTWGIISLVNNSRDKSNVINEVNIKEAARIYSTEADSNSWKKNDGYNYDAFCVTIGELMNKGFLDKNASINGGYTRDDFVIVKRNKFNLAVENEEIVPIEIGNEENEICTGQVSLEEIEKSKIDGVNSYTDRLEISFTEGAAESGIKNYTCLYGESASTINKEGVIEGNRCIIDGLKNNTNYYVFIYMNTNMGSSILAEGPINYKTADFSDTVMTPDYNIVIIEYDSNNINGDGYYYFKSDVDAISYDYLEECIMNDNIFNCSKSNNKIKKDVWYRAPYSRVILGYSSYSGVININSNICDNSNNCHSNSETFEVYNVKFYRNGAESIEGSEAEFIEKRCMAIKGESCSVDVPDVMPVNVCGSSESFNKMCCWGSSADYKCYDADGCDSNAEIPVKLIDGYNKYNIDKNDDNNVINVNSDSIFYAIINYVNYGFDIGWNVDEFHFWNGIGYRTNYYKHEPTSVIENERYQAMFRLKIGNEYYKEGKYQFDYCRNSYKIADIIGDLKWEIDAVKLNGVELPYSTSGSYSNRDSGHNIQIYSLNIDVNNDSNGKIEFKYSNKKDIKFINDSGSPLENYNKLYVLPDTKVTISGNKLTLKYGEQDGRMVIAVPDDGYSFEKWQYNGNEYSFGVVTINERAIFTPVFKKNS